MYSHKHHLIPLYSGSRSSKIHIIISDRKNWSRIGDILNALSDAQEEPFEYDDVGAFFTETVKTGVSNFWMIFKAEKNSVNVNSMGHEIVHCVNAIFKSRGLKLDPDNDEAQAYLTGWVTEIVYKELKRFLK